MVQLNNIYKVYVKIDAESRINAVNSSAFLADTAGWILIDEGTEWPRYHHAQGNYFDGGTFTADGIPRYKLEEGRPVQRTAEEIQADRAAVVTPPTETEQLRADVDFIAAMTGVDLT